MSNWVYNDDGTIEPYWVHRKKKLSPTTFAIWDKKTKKKKYITCGSEEHLKMKTFFVKNNVVESNPILVPKKIADKWYLSEEWKNCRGTFLCNHRKKHGIRICNKCGVTEEDAKMNVDHIYPVRRYWEMRLDQNNLQNLCEKCNSEKGNSMEEKIAERRLIKRDGLWIVLEVNSEPFVCPNWLKDYVVPDWKEEETRSKPEIIFHYKAKNKN